MTTTYKRPRWPQGLCRFCGHTFVRNTRALPLRCSKCRKQWPMGEPPDLLKRKRDREKQRAERRAEKGVV